MILPDQVNTVSYYEAFRDCNFQNFHLPPAMINVDLGIFVGLKNGMVSLQLSESVGDIRNYASDRNVLNFLWNVATPPG